jgi:glycerol kinase
MGRPQHPSRSTAAGIVYLAGLAAGVWSGTEELKALHTTERVFTPSMDQELRQAMLHGWKLATIR